MNDALQRPAQYSLYTAADTRNLTCVDYVNIVSLGFKSHKLRIGVCT